MNQDMLRAPPRRVAITKLALMLLAGILAVIFINEVLMPQMRQYLDASVDRADAIHRLSVVLGSVGLLTFASAGYICFLGTRVLRQGQWPLPDTFVLRDTPIQRGRWVRVRGIGLLILGGLLALNAIAVALIPYFLVPK